MEIYLDANATTAVLPQARAAALAAMADGFGNPSSSHTSGLRARALLDGVRASTRRVLGAGGGQLLFTSGATEGIQTAVLSALASLRARDADADAGPAPTLLLYGATEHKAVPEALRHWNALLGLRLQVLAIPVGRDGRHDLNWLRAHAPRAGLVCTMAANNETGVISDLDGIAEALAGSPALWMVDSVQALGKLALRLADTRIDYAPFSGHKAGAPKGIGVLYVRAGAPLTPLLAGGGQEGALRSGTENMPGIAAFGAVVAAIEEGRLFADRDTLGAWRERLSAALQDVFPGLVFNAPAQVSLPTTLNFSVPGYGSTQLLDLFDAAGIRVSGGSACSAARAEPSHVLDAMGLPAWQAVSAIRLSFSPMSDAGFIEQACERIRSCAESLRRHGHGAAVDGLHAAPLTLQTAADLETTPINGDLQTGAVTDASTCEVSPAALHALLLACPATRLVDVREPFEAVLGGELVGLPRLPASQRQQVPLSELSQALDGWLALPADSPVVFFCRSGQRSAKAAVALRRLGHAQAWSLAGGLALWPAVGPAQAAPPDRAALPS
ncbi:MAG: aminotransferase class V-fold PLP-dependent enzyme, partial [Ideonella sp.]